MRSTATGSYSAFYSLKRLISICSSICANSPVIRRYGLWPVWFRAWPTLVLGVAAHIVFYALTSLVVWKDSDVQEGRRHLAILRASTPLSLFRCLGQDRKRRESSYRCTLCLIFKCVFTLLIVLFDSGVYVTLPCCAVHLL